MGARPALGRSRGVQRLALWVGAVALPLTLVFSVAGAGFYGSPFSEVTREGLPLLVAYLVLGGPLGLLPLAVLARWWPRLSGGVIVAGGACAYVLATHARGLPHVVPHLLVDVGPACAVVALVPVALGAALLATSVGSRGVLAAAATGLISGSATIVALTGVQMRETFAPFRTHHPIRVLAFGPDGRTLFAAGNARSDRAPSASLSAIDPDTGDVTLLAETTREHVLSEDRTILVTVGEKDTLIWDTGTRRVRMRGPRARGPVAASNAAGRAAIAVAGGLQLMNLDGRGRHPPVTYEGQSRWLAWSPDGSTLAIGRSKHDDVLLLDRDAAVTLLPLDTGGDEDVEGRFSPDGRLLAISTQSGTSERVRLWSVGERSELAPIDEAPPLYAEWFSPDGRTLVTSRRDETAVSLVTWLSLWDTTTRRRTASIRAWVAAAWSPDGAVLATLEPAGSGRSRVVLRRVADGAELGEIGQVAMLPTAVAFSPDGARVAVAGDDPTWQEYTRGAVAIFRTGR